MKTLLTNFKGPIILFIIAAILISILEIKSCSKEKNRENPAPTSDTAIIPLPPVIIKSNPIIRNTIVHDTLFKDVDTAEILRSYFSTNLYSDTIRSENVIIHIEESVRENKLIDRTVRILSNQKVIANTNYKTEVRRNQLYVGGSISPTGGVFSIDGVFIPRSREYAVIAGYDLINKQTRLGFVVGINTTGKPKYK